MSKVPTSNKPHKRQTADDTQDPWSKFDRLTEHGASMAADSDPDNPPSTSQQANDMRRVSRVKQLRWQAGLSQQQFADQHSIPLERLQSWERGQAEPPAALLSSLEKSQSGEKSSTHHAMRYEIHRDAADLWHWRLIDSNGAILAVSGQSLATRNACLEAIRAVQQSGFARVA